MGAKIANEIDIEEEKKERKNWSPFQFLCFFHLSIFFRSNCPPDEPKISDSNSIGCSSLEASKWKTFLFERRTNERERARERPFYFKKVEWGVFWMHNSLKFLLSFSSFFWSHNSFRVNRLCSQITFTAKKWLRFKVVKEENVNDKKELSKKA